MKKIGGKIRHLSNQLRAVFASNPFFYATVIVFTISAGWVATASLYPMAFDEEFHLGLIDIYARSWIPYGIEHTRDMAVYGPATADASYLMHYLLSFPYRLMDAIGVPFDTIVVVLRFINIAFVVTALVLFRKVLLEAGVSRAITHLSLALFTLIPIFPMLAGQINYDNLLLPIVALAFLCTVRISKTLVHQHRLPIMATWVLLITILLGMSTKYAILPIAAGMALWLAFVVFRLRTQVSLVQLGSQFARSTRYLPVPKKLLIGVSLIVSLFFTFHYVDNYQRYGNPIPSCEEVFDETACMDYGPWRRNFNMKQSLSPTFEPVSLSEYTLQDWLPGMSQRLTFALAGPTHTYQTKPPLPILRTTLTVLTILGAVCLAFVLFFTRNYRLLFGLTLLACALYVLPLVWRLYLAYVMTGEPVAVNGRYLLPVLPLVAASLIVAMQEVARRARVSRYMSFVASIILIILLGTGGGVATYIVQGESHWFWSGWGQGSHEVLQAIYSWFTLR